MTQGGSPEDRAQRARLRNQHSGLRFWQQRAREALGNKDLRDFGVAAMMVLIFSIAIGRTVGP